MTGSEPPRPEDEPEPSDDELRQWAADAESSALMDLIGLSIDEVERIYGRISPSPPETDPDDPSKALESAKRDRENPVTEADDMADLERIHRQGKIDSDRQDIKLRRLLAVWSIRAATVMLLLGTGIFITYMVSQWGEIPARAIIAWLTASVLEVLGIVYVVANYLFPRDKGE